MINDIMQDAEQRMKKSIEALQGELTKIRTGRANASLLDHVRVDYYGSEVPLSQVANINVEDSRTLALSPWEKTMMPVIEKAIMQSDLGLTPTSAGQVIRVPLPALTEERRRELGKVVAHEGEQGKVAIRNIRRDANSTLKDMEKEKEISEDDLRRAEDLVQKLTDRFVDKIDEMVKVKEKELMEI